MDNSSDKIRILIVDDEPIARRGIRGHLKDVSDIEIIGECANGREAIITIEKQLPDLVFLDIQMPLLDGFGVIENLRVEKTPAFVFVTAFDEHAIRAFEIHALDYLLKPLDGERFYKTLERARKQLRNSDPTELDRKLSALLQSLEAKQSSAQPKYTERIVLKENGRIMFLNACEIDWISSEGNYVKLHVKNKIHLLRETMDAMERKLNPQDFLRLRRSIIARIERIKELHQLFNGEYAVILKDGTELTSSRRYRHNIDVLLKS